MNDSLSDEGGYSCFSGEDDRRFFFKKFGVRAGMRPDFRPRDVGRLLSVDLRDLSWSFGGVVRFSCTFAGADAGSLFDAWVAIGVDSARRCEERFLGVAYDLESRCDSASRVLLMVGRSIEGTEEVWR